MINTISKLKSFGIFQDYKPAKDLRPFVQFNLFYGWNGSGKSTLAKAFGSITDKKVHDHFPEGEFTFAIQDGADITHKNVSSNTINLKVFNKDFIDRNVNFEQSKANSILILSEEKKEELEKYKLLQGEFSTKDTTHTSAVTECEKLKEKLKKDLSKWASDIKKSFELIETSNTYYLNYDRTKLITFIKTQTTNIDKTAILSAEDVKNLKNAIKPNQKNDITFPENKLSSKEIFQRIKQVETLIAKSIFSQQIERLTANPDINLWVKAGLDLHTQHESTSCEFCGQPVTSGRIEELNKHFSKDYDELLVELSDCQTFITEVVSNLGVKVPDALELYDEFQAEYYQEIKTYQIEVANCQTLFDKVSEELSSKIKNPFKIQHTEFLHVEGLIDALNSCFAALQKIVSKHNNKNKGFEDEVKKAQLKLELHFVSEKLIAEDYRTTEKNIKDKDDNIIKQKEELETTKTEISKLEAILLNEAVGAEGFNKNLEKFIGRRDISLAFDTHLKGYKLKRHGKTEAAKNLSEGEKTAIAFVYFITKLKENGNAVESTIVVVDDPISSFDSNHLFHSYSFLKQECEKAKQLFILTHNFQYFKLLRDWILKKNKVEKKADGSVEEKIKANFYSIDSTVEEDRKAIISNADRTLINFNSEYHFICYKLNQYKDDIALNLEKAFLIANMSRKFLEAFLTFKFPKGRNDFMALLQAGYSNAETREKVYRFINKYSHNKEIDFHDTPIDNLIGEGNNIIKDVFNIVQTLDKSHYDEMMEVCAN